MKTTVALDQLQRQICKDSDLKVNIWQPTVLHEATAKHPNIHYLLSACHNKNIATFLLKLCNKFLSKTVAQQNNKLRFCLNANVVEESMQK